MGQPIVSGGYTATFNLGDAGTESVKDDGTMFDVYNKYKTLQITVTGTAVVRLYINNIDATTANAVVHDTLTLTDETLLIDLTKWSDHIGIDATTMTSATLYAAMGTTLV